MSGIGIVSNPRSWRNRRRPETALRLRRLLADRGELREAGTPEALAEALSGFRSAGIDALGVNGGDGTLHRVVTALAASWEGPWPRLLPLRGGTLNTIATAHRLFGPPESALGRFLKARREGREVRAVERDLLRVEAEGLPPSVGFLFGTGLAVSFLQAWHATGHPTAPMALLLALRATASAAVGGRLARDLTRPDAMRATADGDEWPADVFLAVLAGAIPEVGFRLAPLARCDEQPGFFHAVGITGSAAQLALRLPAIWLRRPWRRPLAVDAVARDLGLEAPSLRFTVDGDLYLSRGPVRVRTGPLAQVLSV
jgi:hypothetical protein